MRTVELTVLLILLSGCAALGGPDVVDADASVEDPYGGPLHLRVTEPDHRDPVVRAGAAGQVIECSADPYSGSTGGNWGAADGLGNPVDALEAFVRDEGGPSIPDTGYVLEREEQGRVLFTYSVGGETKVAVIVSEDDDDTSGGDGWGMESFAQCDPAELPDSVTRALDIDVWVDEKEERVPVTVLSSGQGPEHCDWDSATFLHLRGDVFVKDPEGVLPGERLDGTFDPDTSLPVDAEDTGYRLAGQHLWIDAAGSAAFLVTGEEVERWPAADGNLACV